MDATFACAKLSRPDIQKHQQISTKPFYSTRNPTRNPTVQPTKQATNQPTKNMDFGCSHWRIRPELLFAGNFSELGGCWSRTAAKQKLQRLKSQDVLVAVGFMVQKKTTVVYIPTWSFCKKNPVGSLIAVLKTMVRFLLFHPSTPSPICHLLRPLWPW